MNRKWIAGVLAGAMIFLTAAGGFGVSVRSYLESEKQNQKVNDYIAHALEKEAEAEKQENEYKEDGFVIDGGYEIRSTTQISDAYKKGDPSGLSAEDKETYDMASAVLDEIIKDGMTAYEKELAVYDWMVQNIGQGSSTTIQMPGANNGSRFTPNGVLKSKSAVCVGYATTFRLFMNMLGMEVHIVHNDYHSWDLVQLDDGEWYHVDIYSDASSSNKYRNFNMTDDVAKDNHSWEGSALPEAKGLKYNYPIMHAKQLKSIYSVPKKIKKALSKKGSTQLYFSFKEKLTDADLVLANKMYSLCQENQYNVENVGNKDMSAYFYPDGNDSYILVIYISDYESSSNTEENIPKEELEKLYKVINELFNTGYAVEQVTE